MKNLMGEEIQVFIQYSGETGYKTLACATSCSLDVSADDIDISCKDTGAWGATKRGKMSWSINSDCLLILDDFGKLYDKYIAGQNVNVIVSKVANYSAATEPDEEGHVVPSGGWTYDTANCYYGVAQIGSLSLSADNGALSTYSVTLNGVGPLAHGAKS